ncbi:MAG TPA: hypothetical protein V6C90_02515 [Coleofasciculaceae cyanobacterium]
MNWWRNFIATVPRCRDAIALISTASKNQNLHSLPSYPKVLEYFSRHTSAFARLYLLISGCEFLYHGDQTQE